MAKFIKLSEVKNEQLFSFGYSDTVYKMIETKWIGLDCMEYKSMIEEKTYRRDDYKCNSKVQIRQFY
jgi:hypothetical protein